MIICKIAKETLDKCGKDDIVIYDYIMKSKMSPLAAADFILFHDGATPLVETIKRK